MQLGEIGEFGLIDLIKENTITRPEFVVMGIGDDAAVLRPAPGRLQLFTADMLVENVHFRLDTTTPWQLGYKALAVNISDIAAMGGTPRHAVVSVGLPRDISVEFVTELYGGMKEIGHEFGVNIVGGDTVSSPAAVVLNVALLGDVEPDRVIRRSGARPGDLVVVTGTLGDSAGGLALLMSSEWDAYPFAGPLIRAHLTPRPQVRAGEVLAGAGISSMDDISDGLASEINEIAGASKVGARIYSDKLPVSEELQQCAISFGRPALEYALYGGEDFQLVFTIPSDRFSILAASHPDFALTVVGEITSPGGDVLLVNALGQEMPLGAKGYNHFR